MRATSAGDESLTISGVTFENAINCMVTTANVGPSAPLAPGEQWARNQAIFIEGIGEFSIEVHFASDDPATPIYVVTLEGEGLDAPHLRVVEPAALGALASRSPSRRTIPTTTHGPRPSTAPPPATP